MIRRTSRLETVQKISGEVEEKMALVGFENLDALRGIFHRWTTLKTAEDVGGSKRERERERERETSGGGRRRREQRRERGKQAVSGTTGGGREECACGRAEGEREREERGRIGKRGG